jgi:hypothetical protein
MQELHQGLDDMLEYQANEAAPMLLKYAHNPPREDILMDYLYEREVLKDDEDGFEGDRALEELTEELRRWTWMTRESRTQTTKRCGLQSQRWLENT